MRIEKFSVEGTTEEALKSAFAKMLAEVLASIEQQRAADKASDIIAKIEIKNELGGGFIVLVVAAPGELPSVHVSLPQENHKPSLN